VFWFWFDVILGTFVVGLIPSMMAAYGGHLAADSITDNRKRARTKAIFWGLFGFTIVLVFVFQFRATLAALDSETHTSWSEVLLLKALNPVSSAPIFALSKPIMKLAPAMPRQPTQVQSGSHNIQTGAITAAPCSSVQVGAGNQASVNCGLRDRHLTTQQAAAFSVLALPPSVKLGVITSEDSDSQTYASEIYAALGTRENIWYEVGYGRMPPLPRGVFVCVRDEKQLKMLSPIGDRIISILATADIHVDWARDGNIPEGDLEICVGPR